ncbi:MAG: hypothetical protein FWG18_01970 [Alphaproteobacteria bacterium]|nr:hypothetical protein [Alphaproteobacteria bacterium]
MKKLAILMAALIPLTAMAAPGDNEYARNRDRDRGEQTESRALKNAREKRDAAAAKHNQCKTELTRLKWGAGALLVVGTGASIYAIERAAKISSLNDEIAKTELKIKETQDEISRQAQEKILAQSRERRRQLEEQSEIWVSLKEGKCPETMDWQKEFSERNLSIATYGAPRYLESGFLGVSATDANGQDYLFIFENCDESSAFKITVEDATIESPAEFCTLMGYPTSAPYAGGITTNKGRFENWTQCTGTQSGGSLSCATAKQNLQTHGEFHFYMTTQNNCFVKRGPLTVTPAAKPVTPAPKPNPVTPTPSAGNNPGDPCDGSIVSIGCGGGKSKRCIGNIWTECLEATEPCTNGMMDFTGCPAGQSRKCENQRWGACKLPGGVTPPTWPQEDNKTGTPCHPEGAGNSDGCMGTNTRICEDGKWSQCKRRSEWCTQAAEKNCRAKDVIQFRNVRDGFYNCNFRVSDASACDCTTVFRHDCFTGVKGQVQGNNVCVCDAKVQ